MLNWWIGLDTRGKLACWGVFGILVNGVLFLVDLWMPPLFFASIGMLLIAVVMKSEDSTDL